MSPDSTVQPAATLVASGSLQDMKLSNKYTLGSRLLVRQCLHQLCRFVHLKVLTIIGSSNPAQRPAPLFLPASPCNAGQASGCLFISLMQQLHSSADRLPMHRLSARYLHSTRSACQHRQHRETAADCLSYHFTRCQQQQQPC